MRALPAIICIGVLSLVAAGMAVRELPAQEKPPPEKTRRQRIVTDLSGFDLLDTTRVKTQTIVAGATRGADAPSALAPKLGRAFALDPLLTWGCEGNPQSFLVTLWNDAHEEVYRAEVSGRSLRYPPDAPALEPGRTYLWTVSASVSLFGGGGSTPVGILMVAPDQRETIQAELDLVGDFDLYTAGLERARIFTRHRVWYDAIASYTDLIARFPDQAELYEERGMIYAQLDVTQAMADADFARADELAGG